LKRRRFGLGPPQTLRGGGPKVVDDALDLRAQLALDRCLVIPVREAYKRGVPGERDVNFLALLLAEGAPVKQERTDLHVGDDFDMVRAGIGLNGCVQHRDPALGTFRRLAFFCRAMHPLSC